MSKLSQVDWIAAGFRALTEKGPTGIKAEPLARALGTTKGSFYWHFKDVPAFHTAMLEFWQAQAVDGIITQLASLPTSAARLRGLAELAQSAPEPYGGVGAEPAIRAWAKENTAVSEALRRVDQKRIAYVQQQLTELGVSNPDFARVIYAALIGLEDLAHREEGGTVAALGSLVDLVVALGRD